ncbi:MucBP domain-containing protein [Planococcus alpniumensis]|uniref:MucBP domain-containing protein n=1 Tax=Planococcus alpniumensis TaxID=2708345 RepID=UPI0032C46E69
MEGYVVIETPENATGEFGEEAQTVTYVYAKVAEDLTVEYVDEDGNELAASTTQTGTVGEEYATEPVEIEGYVVIETPENATGEFGEEAQTVTYVYAKVAEDLTVEYVDEDGNELAASTTQTGTVGEEYATEPVEIEGYVVIETPENATGEFGEEAQTVTYVYAKVAEDLTVEYVDEDGNELAASTTQTGTVGEEYATEPVEIEGYVVIETPANATGEFGEEAQTVTYVYAKVAEDLTVEYVDEDGNELAESTTQTGTVGEEYATEPVEIEGYVVIETPANATGEFGEEAQTVTYVYAKVAEDLTVEYVDEDGNELAASTTQTGTVGEEYATEPVEIEGYVVIETPANATGEFGEEAQTVTYVYAKVAEDLTVEYVDEDGNELAASTTQTGTVGEEYATEPVEIEGYVVIETPENATGEFGEEAQTVTYVYAKVAEDLTVEYVDEDGNELAESTTQTGTVGEEYATEPVEIEGYVVIETPENATGEFGEEAQTVTYVYAKVAEDLTVEYVDEDGNELAASTTQTGTVGEEYATEPVEIEGYVVIETPANATGEFGEEAQTVTYVYAKVAEDLTVEYVDEDGNELAASTTQTGTVGEEYATEPVEIEGYVVIETPENATGEFGEEAQTVTYVYAKVAEDLTVEYVDEDGNELAESTTQTGTVGEEYATEPVEIEGYVVIETPENATGEFGEEAQTVTYVYAKVAEDLTVEYVDEDGNELAASTTQTGTVGEEYATEPVEIEGYVVIETPENATGEFGEEAQTVTYVYAKVAEDLTVEYVDEDGNELAASTTQTGTVGEEYATEPVEIEGYVVIETPANATGEFGEEAQTVTYVYAKVAEDLTVEYVDEDGNELAASTTQTGTVGEEYATEPVEIEGYVVIETPANATGEFGEEAQTVTYVYAKVAEDLTVEYVDEDGNELAASTTQTGTVGEEYATEPVEIEGYVVIETPENATGEFGEEAQTVTYVYAKVAEDLTVEYVDEDGNELAESTTQTGTVGEEYATEPVEIEGYVVIETPENATGEFGEEAQTVTYVYAKIAGDITVEYVDQEGNELAESTTQTGTVGAEYATEPVEIDGFELVEVPSNATGEFTEDPQTVTYVYQPVQTPVEPGTVTVNHVDEEGNALTEPELLSGEIGTDYTTEAKEFEGYVLTTTPDNASGQFTDEDQTVTYVYAKIASSNSSITVKYVDQEGNELAAPTTQVGAVGEAYSTEPIEVDGFELVEVPSNATGEFTEAPQTVTYVYQPVQTPIETGTVVVNHVDEKGNALTEPELLSGEVGIDYTTEMKEFEGYVLITTPDNASGQFTNETQTVTYVYGPAEVPEVEGVIVVEYVDTEGTPLADPMTDSGLIGSGYTTAPLEIEGYDLVEVPSNAEGVFGDEPQTVTYVYVKKADPMGTIVVVHVDEEGNELLAAETVTGAIGSPYTTEAATIAGYELVQTPGNAAGSFTGEQQIVTYVYAPVETEVPTGTVLVEYVNEQGESLVTRDSLTGEVNSPYSTQPVQIEGYELIATPENATGVFTEGTQVVTYVYALIPEEPVETQGAIVVQFVDEAGNALTDSQAYTGVVGAAYSTDPAAIEGYELIVTPENASGIYTTDTQTITYVYSKIAVEPQSGIVNVIFVDEDGNPLAGPQMMSGVIGEAYSTSPATIDGYELVITPDNANGTFKEAPQTVVYVYSSTEVPVEMGEVTIQHVDQDGNPIADSEKLTGEVGSDYTSNPKEIEGYKLVEQPENADGTFTEDSQTVTYVYEKIKDTPMSGEVKIIHVDQDGNPIADSEKLTGEVGSDYTSNPKEIEGYKLVEQPENADGTFTEDSQTVTYVYEKIKDTPMSGEVKIIHVDQDGNPIADSEKLTGEVGSDYTSNPKEIEGYKLVEQPENADGTFTEDSQTVTYVYEKIKDTPTSGEVKIIHVDQDGNPIADSEKLTGEVGSDYTSNPKEIEGYKLVEQPENADGTFTEDSQTVTYVYEKIMSNPVPTEPQPQPDHPEPDQPVQDKLPQTATNTFNIMIIGGLMMIIGVIMLLVWNKRRKTLEIM